MTETRTPRMGPAPPRLALLREYTDQSRIWSGTVDHMMTELGRAGAEIVPLEPVHPHLTRGFDLVERGLRRIGLQGPMLNRTALATRTKARRLERLLEGAPVDILFAPVSATLIPHLRATRAPVVYVSDATVPRMTGYYPAFTGMSPATTARAMAQERAALARADLILFPTDWAARSAITDYGVAPGKILVRPFGANIADVPDRATALGPRRAGSIRLLFCGVDWARKGGPIALDALTRLRAAGHDVTLSVMGCRPETPVPAGLTPFLRVLPYLDKSDPVQRTRFRDEFLSADLFFLPTRAECYGMVFCEAAACGVPSVTTDTGGVAEVVRDGVTGRVLPYEAGARDYAEAIGALLSDPGRLAVWGQAARDDYEARLNWQVWARDVLAKMAELRPDRPA